MKEKQTITIYGYGYVGKAVAEFLKDHYRLQIIDPVMPNDPPKFADFYLTPENADQTRHAIICVPTPAKENGECDTSAVAGILQNTEHEFYMIKSTVPPKTTHYFSNLTKKNICFSPEYLGEGKYVVQWWKDRGYPHPSEIKYHDFTIFGGSWRATSEFVKIWQRVFGPDHRYIQTDSVTAELTKYMVNAWGAMKVTFCNEFYEIAKALDVDYINLRELFLLDGRTERMHTAVFPDQRGYGGKCFPKDMKALALIAEQAGYEPELIKEIERSNERFKKNS